MTILSSGLETDDYGSPGWNHIYNKNMELLEEELLKLKALQDVDLDAIDDQESFVYNSSTQKWEPLNP